MQIRRILISLSLIIAIFFTQASAAQLSISNCKQEKSNWCWAASAQAIGKYYGSSKTQSSIVSYVKGSAVNESANVYETNNAIIYASSQGTEYDNVLTITEVQLQIDDSDPIAIRIGWNGSLTNGHIMVIGGYI